MKFSFIIIIAILGVLPNVVGQDTPPQRIAEKQPSEQNYFGSTGDIDNGYAVLCGIHSENPISSSGGIANIYKINEAGEWEFTRTMYPEISNLRDRFGQGACAMSGNYVIVGDWMNTVRKTGAAHIFKFWADSSWSEVAYLSPKDTVGVKYFGQSVDIYGDYAVVGAMESAYIFQLQPTGKWKEVKKLNPKSAGFGNHVAMYEDYLVISADWEDDMGAVYVYHRNSRNEWNYVQKIYMNDENDMKENAQFGSSISIYKNSILIGYPKRDIGKITTAGMAYLYELNGDQFELKQEFHADDYGYNNYRFGEKVIISENHIAISQAQDDDYQRAVYIFKRIDGEFKQINRLISPNKEGKFGNEGLAISNDQLYIGAPNDDFCGKFNGSCGVAYFYKL